MTTKYIDTGNARIEVVDDQVAVRFEPTNIFVGGELLGAGSTSREIQLWNPSDSGVNAVIQFADIRGGAAANINVYDSTAVLSTALTLGPGANLSLGGVAPGASMYTSTDATITGTQILEINQPTANIFVDLWELIGATIPPGRGLAFQIVAATALQVRLKWSESEA